MPIPKSKSFLLPLLRIAGDGKTHKISHVYDVLADEFHLTDDDRAEMQPSGAMPLYKNRIAWAKTYLSKAGLLNCHQRGSFEISSRGRATLQEGLEEIDDAYLRRCPEFVEFQKRKGQVNGNAEPDGDPESNASDYSWVEFHKELSRRLLDYEGRQEDLVSLLQKAGVQAGLTDQSRSGEEFMMKEMDPFTFFALIMKFKVNSKRIDIFQILKNTLDINAPLPTGFDGVPTAMATSAWFVGYEKNRKPEDIPVLWKLFQGAIGGKLSTDTFLTSLLIFGVGVPKLTQGLFWANPDGFLPIDSQTRPYLKKHGIAPSVSNLTDYESILSQSREVFPGKAFYEVSYEAWLDTTGSSDKPEGAQYWIYAPGPDACFWDDYYANGIMGVGWDEMDIDLAKFSDKETMYAKNEELYGKKADPKGIHDFVNVVKPGDCVFVKKGRSELVGYGVVESDYFFDSGRPKYRHLRNVNWKKKGSWNIPETFKQLPIKTITPLDDPERISRLLELLEDTPAPPPVIAYSKQDALQDLFMTESTFDEILSLLDYKKNIILQGPPGVGKTFMAKRLAYVLQGAKDDRYVEMVQFHQSYSYEDFMQGIRPNAEGRFEVRNGIFHQFCTKARQDPEKPYCFIIDEINRGNLSKIFGEAMLLIEADKRGKPVTLANSDQGQTFTIPDNVRIIGTMNTADRSLAMVDYALRRRFCFIDIAPAFGEEEAERKFVEYLTDAGAEKSIIQLITERLAGINRGIADDSKNLGPGYCIGHSYFCHDPDSAYDRQWYEKIVRYEIAPLLREYWFDAPDKARSRIQSLFS